MKVSIILILAVPRGHSPEEAALSRKCFVAGAL